MGKLRGRNLKKSGYITISKKQHNWVTQVKTKETYSANNPYRRKMLLLRLRIKLKKQPPIDYTRHRIKHGIYELRENATELQETIKHETDYHNLYPVPMYNLCLGRTTGNKAYIRKWDAEMWDKSTTSIWTDKKLI